MALLHLFYFPLFLLLKHDSSYIFPLFSYLSLLFITFYSVSISAHRWRCCISYISLFSFIVTYTRFKLYFLSFFLFSFLVYYFSLIISMSPQMALVHLLYFPLFLLFIHDSSYILPLFFSCVLLFTHSFNKSPQMALLHLIYFPPFLSCIPPIHSFNKCPQRASLHLTRHCKHHFVHLPPFHYLH